MFHTFRTIRVFEWVTSIILVMLGTIMAAFPVSFDLPSLVAFKEHELFWTLMCLIVGSVRIVALCINGSWPNGTPMIRSLGSIIAAGVFGAFVGNLLKTTDSTHIYWGIATYGGLMLGEIISSYYSAKDAIYYHKYRA